MENEIIKSETNVVALKKMEEEIMFDYNVTLSLEFKIRDVDYCPLCENEHVEYFSRYISSSAPIDMLAKMFFLKTGIIFTDNEIIEHKKHIVIKHRTDDEIQQMAINDICIIDSDQVVQIDENKIIESQIRQLYATSLLFRQQGDMSSAMDASDKLLKWVTLKKKLKDEMPKDETKIMMGDIINIHGEKNETIIDAARIIKDTIDSEE